MKLITIIPIDD